MTLQDALAAAEQLLPGRSAPDGAEDPRWQAIIEVAMFAEHEPEAIWPFVLKWGSHEDEDVRAAVAICLLEHLLEYHFDSIFPRVESGARSNAFLGKQSPSVGNSARQRSPGVRSASTVCSLIFAMWGD
jgi:hypothetical protein